MSGPRQRTNTLAQRILDQSGEPIEEDEDGPASAPSFTQWQAEYLRSAFPASAISQAVSLDSAIAVATSHARRLGQLDVIAKVTSLTPGFKNE